MANATQTATANTVDSAVFTNTTSGTLSTDRRGRTDFEPKRDRDGKLVYSTTLKAVTQQTDRNFPAVITADKVTAIAGGISDTHRLLINQNEIIESRFDDILAILTKRNELDKEKTKLQNELIESSGSYERLTHPVLVGDGGNGKLVDKSFAVFTENKDGKRAARCYPKTFAGGL